MSVRFAWIFALLIMSLPLQGAESRLNVLFIAVDDLRPELGCYGSEDVRSPNIDSLASRSLVFNRAYCQYPLCSPSRTSVLTGLRPYSTQIYDLKTSFRTKHPDLITLPQLFKNNGFHTRSIGKIFHGISGLMSDPKSWSEPPVYGRDRALTPDGKKRAGHGLPCESPVVDDNMLPDGDIAGMAVKALQENAERPFFLAVGFMKPHLPFVAPKKYWSRFDSTSVPLAANQSLPVNAPEFASNHAGELRQYVGIPKSGAIADEEQRNLKEGYLACVEYMDAQLGRVLTELDRLGLRDKTIIVLWGDHGYQLGEHGTWTKHTVWELSARVPFILSDPSGAGAGKNSDALVELVDIYPTLVEMCKLTPPANLEGKSIVPLLKNPDIKWKSAAFTSFRKLLPAGRGIGRSMRTDRFRFVKWSSPKMDKPVFELYDEKQDPNENVNIANRPENRKLIKRMEKQLKAGWRAADK